MTTRLILTIFAYLTSFYCVYHQRTQWEEERERIRTEERKKKLFDFEVGSSCLSLSCQCWGGSLLVQDDDDEY